MGKIHWQFIFVVVVRVDSAQEHHQVVSMVSNLLSERFVWRCVDSKYGGKIYNFAAPMLA